MREFKMELEWTWWLCSKTNYSFKGNDGHYCWGWIGWVLCFPIYICYKTGEYNCRKCGNYKWSDS